MNGLVAAFYLAREGRAPIVLERAAQVGGVASTEEFLPGFRASMVVPLAGPANPGCAHCRRRRSALPDHEWVTSGCFAYRAPISCIDPRDALAVGEGLARMTTPASLARLGWLHFYGSALPTRVLPPVARLYFGVPSRRRRAFWDRLWPMLSDAIPVIEAKILDDARLARNDPGVTYPPVGSAGPADPRSAQPQPLWSRSAWSPRCGMRWLGRWKRTGRWRGWWLSCAMTMPGCGR